MYRGKVPALYVTPDRSVPAYPSGRGEMQAADVPPEPLTPELSCVQEGLSRDKAPVPHLVPGFRLRTTAPSGFLQGKKRKKVQEFHRYGYDTDYLDSCSVCDWAER